MPARITRQPNRSARAKTRPMSRAPSSPASSIHRICPLRRCWRTSFLSRCSTVLASGNPSWRSTPRVSIRRGREGINLAPAATFNLRHGSPHGDAGDEEPTTASSHHAPTSALADSRPGAPRPGRRRACSGGPAAGRGGADLVGDALLGDAEDRHDDHAGGRQPDAEQRLLGPVAVDQRPHRFEPDLRGEQEELQRDEASARGSRRPG